MASHALTNRASETHAKVPANAKTITQRDDENAALALVLRQTMTALGRSKPEVADAFGVCTTRVSRFLDPFDDACPNALHLKRCRAHDLKLYEEYERQLASHGSSDEDASPSSIVMAVLEASHEAGDVSRVTKEALNDKHTPGVITRADAMAAARECAEAAAASLRAQRLFEKVARGGE